MISRRACIALLVFCVAAAWLGSVRRAGAQSAPTPQIARGAHLANALAGCADCHGASFAGGRPFTRGAVVVYSANLTGGAGGIGAVSDADIARAIRAGIAPDGRALWVMPREYAAMTDDDVAALIAYLRSLPPVDRTVTPPSQPPPPAAAPAAAPAAPLSGGAYLATIGGCINCHGADLAGHDGPGGVAAPNISHAGIGTWSFADFQTAMRTGTTPTGHVLSKVMPWENLGKMTDAELRTLYDYLQAQPGAPNAPS